MKLSREDAFFHIEIGNFVFVRKKQARRVWEYISVSGRGGCSLELSQCFPMGV